MFVGIEPAQDPLPPKEWNQHLEGLLNTGQMNPDIIPFLNHRQAWCMNEIKKAFDRFQRRSTPFIAEDKYTKNYVGKISEDTEGVESTESTI